MELPDAQLLTRLRFIFVIYIKASNGTLPGVHLLQTAEHGE